MQCLPGAPGGRGGGGPAPGGGGGGAGAAIPGAGGGGGGGGVAVEPGNKKVCNKLNHVLVTTDWERERHSTF